MKAFKAWALCNSYTQAGRQAKLYLLFEKTRVENGFLSLMSSYKKFLKQTGKPLFFLKGAGRTQAWERVRNATVHETRFPKSENAASACSTSAPILSLD